MRREPTVTQGHADSTQKDIIVFVTKAVFYNIKRVNLNFTVGMF